MKALLRGAFLLVACATVAACGGGGTLLTPQPVAPVPGGGSGPPGAPAPTSVSTSVPLANGAALVNAPLSMPAPAPTGYAQSVTASLVTAAANTTVQITAGASPPASLVPLSTARGALGLHRLASTGSYTTVFYDAIVPSANITVAGNISYTASFPSGGIAAGTPYYLGFYDTTQSSPAWQTIAGPVSPSGANVTFSGTIGSLTLVANKVYGFAIFTGVVPSATPPPAPTTLVYFGNSTALTIASETGTVVNTLNIPSQSFDLDDAGNVYAFNHNASPQLAMYPAGSATPAATYQPSLPNRLFVAVSGAGEVAAVHFINGNGILTTDVWDPGQSGPPSRTLTTSQSTNFAFVMAHDGTLYLPDSSPAGVPQYDVFPPGASTPATTIPETIVPAAQYPNFAPNYAAVGADGTLYVTEYTFGQPDPNAGLYIYPLGGPERFVATPSDSNGPGPQGVDVDASGNIYVVNNNSAVTSASTCQGDSLSEISVFSSAGQLLRTIGGPFTAFPITVAADGTAFLSSFPVQLQPGCATTGVSGIFSIAPGATTATQISASGSTEIVLFDGTHKTNPFRSGSHGTSSAHAGGRGGFIHGAQRRPFGAR